MGSITMTSSPVSQSARAVANSPFCAPATTMTFSRAVATPVRRCSSRAIAILKAAFPGIEV